MRTSWKPSWCAINRKKTAPGLIIVIPCHDEPELLVTLDSLAACELPGCPVQVRVVINASEDASREIQNRNHTTHAAAGAWIGARPRSPLTFILHHHPDLPAKHAGVGLARKIGMDAAAAAFKEAGYADGPIVCLDADCTVAPNYLVSLVNHFAKHAKTPGCSIHYEHPLEGLPPRHRLGIAAYELYLRYYRQGLRWAGHPGAFHTVGSSMAVRADVYLKQGGMNRRKAGEDFYFLEKIIALGNFTEIFDTCVIPSPRRSPRVPFGTGRAMEEWLSGEEVIRLTYDPRVFADLKEFFQNVPRLYEESIAPRSPVLAAFLIQGGFEEEVARIRANTTSSRLFEKKFYHWFNLFKVLKYIHWATEHHYPKVPLEDATRTLWQWLSRPGMEQDIEGWLTVFRKVEIEQGLQGCLS